MSDCPPGCSVDFSIFRKMFSIILWRSLTRQNKKDTLVDAAAWGHFIALLFHFLEFSSKMISPFLERINPNLIITLRQVYVTPK